MSNPASRWFSRAPRYVLRPEDNQFIRFSNQSQRIGTGIEIRDISKTGMAFTVHRHQAPRIGETMMIEFEVPGQSQMACYARVVRLEEPKAKSWGSSNQSSRAVIVAVTFVNMQKGQMRFIDKGLSKRFEQLEANHNRLIFRRRLNWLKENTRLGIIYGACILALILVFYYLTQPRANYNKYSTVPWGTRTF